MITIEKNIPYESENLHDIFNKMEIGDSFTYKNIGTLRAYASKMGKHGKEFKCKVKNGIARVWRLK